MNIIYFLVDLLLDPLSLFWMLIIFYLITKWFNKLKVSPWLLVVALTWLFIISVSPVPQWLIHNLENDFEVLDVSKVKGPGQIRILILGGGHTIAPTLPPTGQLTPSALSRLTEGIRISKLIKDDLLVCSGYSSSGRTTQGEMLAAAAMDLGINNNEVLIIKSPANTKEEAEAYSLRFPKDENLIIVTSACHMKRAMLYFTARNLKPVPAPTDYFIKKDPVKSIYDFYPSAQKIQMMTTALHEYGGMIKFYLFS
jgi:uncharacterized SAM-binding protein YcdF (DUF218 family)